MARSYLPHVELCEDRLVLDGQGGLGAALLPALTPALTPLAPVVSLSDVKDTVDSVAKAVTMPLAAVASKLPSIVSEVDSVTWVVPQLAQVTHKKPVELPVEAGHKVVTTKPSHVKAVKHKTLRPVDSTDVQEQARPEPEQHQEVERADPKPGPVTVPVTENEVRAAERTVTAPRGQDARASAEDAKVERQVGEKNDLEQAPVGRERGRPAELAPAVVVRHLGELVDTAVIGTAIQVDTVTERTEISAVADSDSPFGSGDGLLTAFLPFDSSQLEASVTRILDQLNELRSDATEWLLSGGMTPWVTVAAAAMMIAEIARRQRRLRQTESGPVYLVDGAAVS